MSAEPQEQAAALPGFEGELVHRWSSPTAVVNKAYVPDMDRLLRWAWSLGRRNKRLDEARAESVGKGNAVGPALAMLKTGGRPAVLAAEPDHRSAIEGLLAWWDDWRPDVTHVELSIKSEELRLRGRIDYVRRCHGCSHCDFLRRCLSCGAWVDGAHGNTLHDCAGRRPGDILGETESFEGGGYVLGDTKTGRIDNLKTHLQVGGFYPLIWSKDRQVRHLPLCAAEIVHLSTDYEKGYSVVLPHALATPSLAAAGLSWFQDARRLSAAVGGEADDI